MKIFLALVVILATGVSAPTWAAVRTVTLSVPGMTCPTCPITIRTALDRVHGVEGVKSNVAKRTVTISYDDDRTAPSALMKATTNAGYPSTVVRTDTVDRIDRDH